MEEILNQLREIHKDIKNDRPRGGKLNGNAAYRNGFEDGYKLITRRCKAFIEAQEQETIASHAPDPSTRI